MRKFRLAFSAALSALAITACQQSPSVAAAGDQPFTISEVAKFDTPWAMTFLPNGDMLVTEKSGTLKWLSKGVSKDVAGTPKVDDNGQGSLGDILAAPDYATTGTVYLTFSEPGDGGNGAALARAKLVLDANPRLEGLTVIWRQTKVADTDFHYSQKLVFSPDGKYLFVTAGERNKKTPAQDVKVNLGKVLRLTLDGKPAPGNPFAAQGGQAAEVWSYGHRNLYGLAFAPGGQLWEDEMGPKGGDELNLIVAGKNYGWPVVSNGSGYDDADIPDHPTRPEFEAPKVWWNPSISPSSLIIYTGDKFPQWKGDAFIGALSGQALIRVDIDGSKAAKADQWDMETRIRDVEQGPDGNIYLLEDGDGRLLKLSPKS
jgi:aldose sugar dehydrogenase